MMCRRCRDRQCAGGGEVCEVMVGQGPVLAVMFGRGPDEGKYVDLGLEPVG